MRAGRNKGLGSEPPGIYVLGVFVISLSETPSRRGLLASNLGESLGGDMNSPLFRDGPIA